MKKVYIVIENIEAQPTIGGVYASLKAAREHAQSVAEYAGVSEHEPNRWGGEDYSLAIQEQPVL